MVGTTSSPLRNTFDELSHLHMYRCLADTFLVTSRSHRVIERYRDRERERFYTHIAATNKIK